MLNKANLGADDIDLLSVISGPGSFTGLRIGLAGVLGWGVSKGIPIQPVNTFQALKATVSDSSYPLLIVIHSRGVDFYIQYLGSAAEAENAEPFIGTVEISDSLQCERCSICGPGAARFLELLEENMKDRFEMLEGCTEPDLTAVCQLADTLHSEGNDSNDDYMIEPYYMTLSQAQINFEKREGRV
jgi:tRNA threonylcarbamoyladenosine biosynthesis protein TsaB